MGKIIEFIGRRFTSDCHWTNGNCLWFAIILTTRFPELEIYYLPIQGHFIVGSQDNVFFDWTGMIVPSEKPYRFEKIRETDPLWYSHLIRDCFE